MGVEAQREPLAGRVAGPLRTGTLWGMLALVATWSVSRQVATSNTITPVSNRAAHGVLREPEIFAKNGGSIRSLPRAYEARVAE